MNLQHPPTLLGAGILDSIGSTIMDAARGTADVWNRMSRPHVVQEAGSTPAMDPIMTGLIMAGAIGIAGFALMKKKRRI